MKEKDQKWIFLHLGVKRVLEDSGKDQNQETAKRSKQDEELKRSIKKKLRHLPRKVSYFNLVTFFQGSQSLIQLAGGLIQLLDQCLSTGGSRPTFGFPELTLVCKNLFLVSKLSQSSVFLFWGSPCESDCETLRHSLNNKVSG